MHVPVMNCNVCTVWAGGCRVTLTVRDFRPPYLDASSRKVLFTIKQTAQAIAIGCLCAASEAVAQCAGLAEALAAPAKSGQRICRKRRKTCGTDGDALYYCFAKNGCLHGEVPKVAPSKRVNSSRNTGRWRPNRGNLNNTNEEARCPLRNTCTNQHD